MARQARISARQLAVAAIVACVACSSVASGAKCWPKQPTITSSPSVDTPATTEEAEVTTDAPTLQQETQTPEVTQPTETTGSVASSSDRSSSTPPSAQTSTAGSSGDTATQGSTGGTSGAATFGDISSASGQCVVGNPKAYVSTKEVDWVWENRMSKYVPDFKNYIFDQLVTNNGSLTYCVRWDSTNKLEKTVASKFEAMLNRQFKAWNEWLIGYECWPFEKIDVKIVGWATRDASLFDWSDDSLGTIYDSDKDADGIPQCPDDCYKHRNFAASSDTSACKGKPFDMSLWPTKGQGGGAGGDWGQRVDEENMVSTIDQEQLVIVAHEIGHGFGLPDFYEATDKPSEDFPSCIMMAGSSPTITPSDGWMLRRVLEHVKSRYKF